jgi:hypothetical protein
MAVSVADVWDSQDNNLLSRNELVHGSAQVHELGPGSVAQGGRDVDFFRMGQAPLASYEVIVDGPTDQLAASGLREIVLQRYQDSAQVQDSVATHAQIGASRSLRWENTVNSSLANGAVRVTSTAPCTFNCSSSQAVYHIRAYETTYSIPRFNNSATQVTVLLMQNAGGHAVSGRLHFLSVGGAVLGTHPFALLTRQQLVLVTSTLPFAAGASGSIVVTHDGRYGDLAGKAVALEPATGFSFDTLLTPRPR